MGGRYILSQDDVVTALSRNIWLEREWMLEEGDHHITFIKNRYGKNELVWGDEYA